jgi:hypothetical protein
MPQLIEINHCAPSYRPPTPAHPPTLQAAHPLETTRPTQPASSYASLCRNSRSLGTAYMKKLTAGPNTGQVGVPRAAPIAQHMLLECSCCCYC